MNDRSDQTDRVGDDAFAGVLAEAMSDRAHQLRATEGSLRDVHTRFRRNARRRTAVGVGAVAIVGVAGAVAWSRSGGDGTGPRLYTGAAVGGGPTGPADATAGYWLCSGEFFPGGNPSSETAVTVQVSTVPVSTFELPTVTPTTVLDGVGEPAYSTVPTAMPIPVTDGPHYMRDCRFVDETSATTPLLSVVPIDPTSTTALAPPTTFLAGQDPVPTTLVQSSVVSSTVLGTLVGPTVTATSVPPTSVPIRPSTTIVTG